MGLKKFGLIFAVSCYDTPHEKKQMSKSINAFEIFTVCTLPSGVILDFKYI